MDTEQRIYQASLRFPLTSLCEAFILPPVAATTAIAMLTVPGDTLYCFKPLRIVQKRGLLLLSTTPWHLRSFHAR